MKKFIFTPKAKKITIIAGIAVVCAGVLSFSLLQNANAKSDNLPSASSNTSDADLVSASSSSPTVAIIGNNGGVASGTAGTGSAWTPSSGKNTSAPLTSTASKPQAPAKPKIQGDSVNGKQPTNSALTNKAQKPSYTTPPKAPTTQKSTGNNNGSGMTTKKSSNGGSTNKSGGSDPIFKNGYDKGTGGQETVIEGNWGSGSQVGIMD